MTRKIGVKNQTGKKPLDLIKGWAALLICVGFLWAFIFYIGPWIESSVPAIKQITDSARERDIDTTAFFYSENKESYEAEHYLKDTFDATRPEGYGFNGYFLLGIGCAITILIIGFRFLPGDKKR